VGTYDIGVKNWTCLSEVERGIVFTAGNNTYQDFGNSREGDANNDDRVRASDLALLVSAYDSQSGQPGWNAHCDFDRNNKVASADLAQLVGNYNANGDPYP